MGASSTTHTYDTADRMLSSGGDTGLVYDTFGRLTTVPAADVIGGANVSVSYYANDLVGSSTFSGVSPDVLAVTRPGGSRCAT